MIREHNGEEEIPLLRLIPLINRTIGVHEKAKEYTLTKSQLFFMTALYYRGNLSMGRIAEFISSSKEQATRAVAPLVEKGLVRRFETEENRTHVYIELTGSGKKLMDDLKEETRVELHSKLRSALSEEEQRQLAAAVETVVSLLKKI